MRTWKNNKPRYRINRTKKLYMNKVKNVIFDLGGVVLHLDRQQAVSRFEAMGIADAGNMLDAYRQNGIFLQVEDGTLDAEAFRSKLSELAGRELSYDTIAHGWLGFIREVPAYKLEYILKLRQRCRVFLLSNTNPFIMNWARSAAFSPAGRPITDYFDKLYASYEMKMFKPNPDIFDYVLKDSGVNPAETLFLDDGEANVKAAARFGIQVYQPKDGEDWRGVVDTYL